MSFPSGSDMMSKELQNSDFIYVNQMTDILKIIVKYRWKIIAKYRIYRLVLLGTEFNRMLAVYVS